MELTTEHLGKIAIIKPQCPQLDMSNYEEFRKLVSEILIKERYIILDMEQVEFMDSSAASVVLYCLRNIKMHNGKLKICNPSEAVDVTLKLLRMGNLTEIYTTRQEAIEAFEDELKQKT